MASLMNGRTDARWKKCPRFDFSSRTDRLPRDKSEKELRFDECPSGRTGPTVSLHTRKTSISPGPAIHEKRGQYRAQQKLHAHLGFAWSAPGRPRRQFPRRRRPTKPSAPQRRIVNFKGVSIMRTAYQMSRGLPSRVTPWLKSLSWEIHLPRRSLFGLYVRSFPSLPSILKRVIICIPRFIQLHIGYFLFFIRRNLSSKFPKFLDSRVFFAIFELSDFANLC